MEKIEYSEEKMNLVRKKVQKMISTVAELEEAFPGRHFTLDGHLVGSIGEVLAAYYYGIDLYKASNPVHDGIVDGKEVQIKITQRDNIVISKEPDYLIVLYLTKRGDVFEVYNGRGKEPWKSASKEDNHNNRHMFVSKLMRLDKSVPSVDRIPMVKPITKMKDCYKNAKKRPTNEIDSSNAITMNATIDYYNKNANEYVESTIDVVFTAVQDRFLKYLPEGAYILDFGCGSGRDTRYFLGKGFQVDALDGSEEFCRIASQNTGIEVRQCMFEDFKADRMYDGIWACSSILHLTKEKLRAVVPAMIRALKDRGIIYTSFKYGEFEGERHGRHFTDFTEASFQEFLKDIDGAKIIDSWVAGDVRPGRGDEKWLNLILKKK